MNRGYIKLWRKVLDNPVLHERGKRFSRLEAWIFLCLKANGMDSESGMKRGEFQFSIRYLAAAWNWGHGQVERFLRDLQEGKKPMIMKADFMVHQTGQQTGQFVGHFIICNYDTYNPRRDTKQDSKQDSKQDKVKEVFNEVLKKEEEKPSAQAPASPSENSDERQKPLKEFIESEYQRIRGCRMISDNVDWIQFAALLKRTKGDPAFNLARLKGYWTAMLNSDDPFHQKQGHPLRYFATNINAFVSRPKEKTERERLFGH